MENASIMMNVVSAVKCIVDLMIMTVREDKAVKKDMIEMYLHIGRRRFSVEFLMPHKLANIISHVAENYICKLPRCYWERAHKEIYLK